MTFEPQTIETTDLISTGTSKINDNFEAIAQEFENVALGGVADIVGDMLSGTQTYISVTYDDENNELDFVVDATATPTASKIPVANGSGKLAAGWGGAASTLATLNASSLVVENPANATATPTASKIPIADGSAKLDGWVSLSTKADAVHTHSYSSTDHDATHITSGSDEIDGDKLDIDWNPANYTPTLVTNYADSVDNLTAHLKGIDDVSPTSTEKGALVGTIGTPSSTNPFVTNDDYEALSVEINADRLDLNYIPSGYTATLAPDATLVTQLASHLKGISDKLAELESRIEALE